MTADETGKVIDEQDEPMKPRYTTCADRMCGAEDCPNCRPGNFQAEVFVDDIEKEPK